MAAILYRDGKVLIVRRGPGNSGAGFWEFPGGKVEPGESPEQALQREILEEVGVRIKVEEHLGENVHQYPGKKIRLNFYWAKLPAETLNLTEHDASQMIKPEDLDVSILSEADRPIVEVIRQNPRMKV
ncbi:(deoxy)nucleoside triphosphate pyrophosphohydrolase [Bdellovibrio sp. HCB337]|uniref:(deoxy)nucleoside triphosphate pyrophosphohydrolase n=1 Tax=Bdellovibrio sp. HCB337 TaxID=3394358 RepID=UPI0039A51820